MSVWDASINKRKHSEKRKLMMKKLSIYRAVLLVFTGSLTPVMYKRSLIIFKRVKRQ